MANSGLQLLGFLLSLMGLAATAAATIMVEWKKQSHGKSHRIYEGLWKTCTGHERTTCEYHHSLLKLPSKSVRLWWDPDGAPLPPPPPPRTSPASRLKPITGLRLVRSWK